MPRTKLLHLLQQTDGQTDGRMDGRTEWGIAIALSQIGWLGAKKGNRVKGFNKLTLRPASEDMLMM